MATGSILDLHGLQAIIDALRGQGFTVIGPTHRDGAIVLAEITGVGDLPRGWRRPGRRPLPGQPAGRRGAVRLRRYRPVLEVDPVPGPRAGVAGNGTGPGSPSSPGRRCRPVRPARGQRATCTRSASTTRCCWGAPSPTGPTQARRDGAFIVAVACSHPGGTCFCVSMGTGPRPESGFDLSLTELLDAGGHRFVVTAGSSRGAEPAPLAGGHRGRDAGRRRPGRGRRGAGPLRGADGPRTRHRRTPRPALRQSRAPPLGRRGLPLPVLHELHPGLPDLLLHVDGGRHRPDRQPADERHRVWDSCFTSDYSHLSGGSVRASTRSATGSG